MYLCVQMNKIKSLITDKTDSPLFTGKGVFRNIVFLFNIFPGRDKFCIQIPTSIKFIFIFFSKICHKSVTIFSFVSFGRRFKKIIFCAHESTTCRTLPL